MLTVPHQHLGEPNQEGFAQSWRLTGYEASSGELALGTVQELGIAFSTNTTTSTYKTVRRILKVYYCHTTAAAAAPPLHCHRYPPPPLPRSSLSPRR